MSKLKQLLGRLGRVLREHRLPYMIIGGQAVNYHGHVRGTDDIDITLDATPESLPVLLAAIDMAKLKVLVDDPESFVCRTYLLFCSDPETGMKIDFVFSATPYEHQAIERAARVPIAGEQVCYATVEDILIHKFVAGRPIDMDDTVALVERHPSIDVGYVSRWLKQFEVVVEKPLDSEFQNIWRKRKPFEK